MKTSHLNNQERTFSFREVANQLGVTEEELILVAKQEGLLDENGLPTEFAINKGLLAIEPNFNLN
ncbi:MAG: hypothetical protein JNK09_01505 [Prolixibacteraceae bacterium]|nr:hypothetical protein [Prolixibacteraceae bacterium]